MADLTPFKDTSPVPQPAAERDRGPLPAPAWWTSAGVRDRRAEESHTLAVRQMVRGVELARVQIAGRHAVDVAELEAASMRLTERKLQIDQQHRLSLALAGEDPVLQAKFAVLDDDFMHAQRVAELRREGRS